MCVCVCVCVCVCSSSCPYRFAPRARSPIILKEKLSFPKSGMKAL